MKTGIAGAMLLSLLLAACARIGSETWCEKMGDWTANEAGTYAKNCLVGRSE